MKENNQNRGFTLVELLITVAILAIIVAPFLATFVMASGNNLNAAQKQDAANLAEDIAEEIKGKSLDALEKTPDWTWKAGPNHASNPQAEYEFDIPSTALPNGIKSGFSAEARLEPATNPINDEMPVLTSMNGTDTILLMSGFYANDNSIVGASYRESTITISCDAVTGEYKVSLDVEYFDSSNHTVGGGSTRVSEVTRSKMPSIFAVYTTMGANDKLILENLLTDDEMESTGEFIPLDFYLSVQRDSTIPNIINHARIEIIDEGTSNPVDTYISNNIDNDDRRINVYTNADVSVTNYKKSLVKEVQSDKLYDLIVEVYYGTGSNRRKCAEFKSSKLRLS